MSRTTLLFLERSRAHAQQALAQCRHAHEGAGADSSEGTQHITLAHMKQTVAHSGAQGLHSQVGLHSSRAVEGSLGSMHSLPARNARTAASKGTSANEAEYT